MIKSQWNKGVALYAKELLEKLFEHYSPEDVAWKVKDGFGTFTRALWYGASSWDQYSEGGCALIYDEDIAERLCPPSRIRRLKDGSIAKPSMSTTWIDVQTRALVQASWLAYSICKHSIFTSVDKDKVFEEVIEECGMCEIAASSYPEAWKKCDSLVEFSFDNHDIQLMREENGHWYCSIDGTYLRYNFGDDHELVSWGSDVDAVEDILNGSLEDFGY